MHVVMHGTGQILASDSGTLVFPGPLLCKLLCRLLCKLLCRVSVACMHNKLRVRGGAGSGEPRTTMTRIFASIADGSPRAGGVTWSGLHRHRRWVGRWRAGWVKNHGPWLL